VWDSIPRDRWAADSAESHLVGSGPYRIDEWRRGQFLRLVADTLRIDWALPRIRQAVWRFAADPDAALNLVLSHEADLLETAGAPDRVQRVLQDTSLQVAKYPTAIYGFLAFRIQDGAGRPHPLLGRREVRCALTEALNRPTIARALFGPGTKVPPGPMSQLLWIWDDKTRTLPFDSSRARAVLANTGRRIDILVPSTSSVRRQLAQVIQESWRRVGVEATITTVDFPVFQERLAKGRFYRYIGAYLDEPSPRGLADQWSRSGWGALNYGHYANPAFDSLLSKASETSDVANARQLWREAMDTLNADAPGIFLYAPENVAVLNRRLAGVKLDPYSWVSGLSRWGVGQERVLAAGS
jgi:peptide/nickel transport system substrate-binding protein